jgi:hypothetical protein
MAAMANGRFDANFASRTYLIETVIYYPFFCGGGIRNLSRPAASTQELKGLAAQQRRHSPDRNTLLTTLRNSRYTAGFCERFNPNEISRC